MKKLIVGNWKLNKTIAESKEWASKVKAGLAGVAFEEKIDVVVCPTFVHLPIMESLLEGTGIALGAQDISSFEEGTYTGEVSGKQLESLVDYTIVGHSERRKYFDETNKSVAEKVVMALNYNLIPVVCVSDVVSTCGRIPNKKLEYNEGDFLNQMAAVLDGLSNDQRAKVIFCFEPPSAISKQKNQVGTGTAASAESVKSVIEKIRQAAPLSRIMYGGSVKSSNVAAYLSEPAIDGVLPGSASLDAEEFAAMIKNAAQVLP